MKDSGVAWIGEIPEGWEVKKLGNFYTQRNEKVSDKDYAPLSVTMQGILPQLETAAKTNDGDNRKLVKKGDFAINSRSDRRGSCGISPYDGSVSLINTILCPKGKMDAGFYNWLFHTTMFADEYYKWGHGIVDDLWTTRWSEMKKISVVTPPLSEQSRIASFLDEKCGEIDSLISLQEEMISELQAYKQSVITEAVTKGLDKNVKMKDSGEEWIGIIPAKWDMRRLKFVFSIKKDIAGKEGFTVLSITQKGIVPKDISKNEGQIAESYANYQFVNTGDFAMNHMDLLTGGIGISQYVGVTSPDYRVFVLNDKLNYCPEYYLYLFLSCYYNKIFFRLAQGVSDKGRRRLQADKFLNFVIPVPPLSEQTLIAAYLDTKTSQIDSLISLKHQKIEELKLYKKSIIYEYVTGKKDVI